MALERSELALAGAAGWAPRHLTQPVTGVVHGLSSLVGGPEYELAGDGALALENGRIVAVGTSAAVLAQCPGLPRIDGTGFSAAPGLVNAHVHTPMGFFRGLGLGRESMVETFMFPAEKALTPELLEPLSYGYLVAGLRGGATTFGEHYYFSSGVARAMDRLGLRGAVGETVADLGGAFPGREGWERWKKAMAAWAYSSRVTPVIAPHAADTVSPALLKELAAAAKSSKLPLHLHLAQSRGEHDRVMAREGMTPVAYAERAGALGPSTLAVHLTAIDAEDARRLGAAGATAGYCPASQLIFEKLAPIRELAAARVPLALGTDCAASNDGADLFSEMKLATLLGRDRGLGEEWASPAASLAMASTNGARVLGLEKTTGRLAPGMAADVLFLADAMETWPAAAPLNNLVLSTSPRQVAHVLVDGLFVLVDGKTARVDERELEREYRAAVKEIARRVGF